MKNKLNGMKYKVSGMKDKLIGLSVYGFLIVMMAFVIMDAAALHPERPHSRVTRAGWEAK